MLQAQRTLDFLDASYENGKNMLHYASEFSHDQMVPLILMTHSHFNRISLDESPEHPHEKTLKLLESKNRAGMNPLHIAAQYANDKVIEKILLMHEILSARNLNLNESHTQTKHLQRTLKYLEQPDPDGRAPLLVAASNPQHRKPMEILQQKHELICRKLYKDKNQVLEKIVSFFEMVDNTGENVLHKSVKSHRQDVICFILEKHEQLWSEFLKKDREDPDLWNKVQDFIGSATAFDEHTCLHIAALNIDLGYIEERAAIFKLLCTKIKREAVFDQVDLNYETVTDKLKFQEDMNPDNTEIVKSLIEIVAESKKKLSLNDAE